MNFISEEKVLGVLLAICVSTIVLMKSCLCLTCPTCKHESRWCTIRSSNETTTKYQCPASL